MEIGVVLAASAFMYRRYLLLRPWIAATALVYLLYWIYVYIVWI